MMNENKLKTLEELFKEAENLKNKAKDHYERYYSTIGVVVDCSNIFRYESNRDYTQKLKIIDHTYQQSSAQVYLWSNRKQDFSNNIKIGDIIFLSNFRIELYNTSLQIKKVFKNQDSYFRIFNGQPQISNYSPNDKKVGLDDNDGSILNAIVQLRKFNKKYFVDNKVPLLLKQNFGVKQEQKKIISSDFDLILRVVQCNQVSNHFKLVLTDQKQNFHLNYIRYINPGVYKLRSIANAKKEDKICLLTGNDYTYFLQIQPWMKSYKVSEWDLLILEESKAHKIKRAKISSKIITKKQLNKITLKQLIQKDDHQKEVKVIVQVMDIRTPFQKALKKYDRDNHTQKPYHSQAGDYIYSIHLLISDESLEGQVMNAYIYTFDGRGLQFLPDLQPQGIYGRNILDYKSNYENFMNRLLEESDYRDTPLQIVLSPLWNGKQTIYRIVDTRLLF